MASKELFGSLLTGIYVSPVFLGLKRFLFFDKSVPLTRVLEVDLSPHGYGDLVVVGVSYLSDDGTDLTIRTAAVPLTAKERLYETLNFFGYPVKEFYPPRRMSDTRRRLEQIVKARGSLRGIDPSELYS